MAFFNNGISGSPGNYQLLPPEVKYEAIAADVDADGDGNVGCGENQLLRVIIAKSLTQSSACDGDVAAGLRALYDTVLHFQSVTVGDVVVAQHPCGVSFFPFRINFCDDADTRLISQPTPSPEPNDNVVTMKSAVDGPVFKTIANLKKDHFAIADAEVARLVLRRAISIERQVGDLR